jgi:hypothetical protein
MDTFVKWPGIGIIFVVVLLSARRNTRLDTKEDSESNVLG